MKQRWFSYEWRVRYHETDQMGVVYHANYASWFEIGRTELIRQLGVTYASLEARGLLLPLTELQIKYKQPARYDDLVEIRTTLVRCTPIRLEFAVEVWRENELLVEGATQHVWVGPDWKPLRLDKVDPALYSLIRGTEGQGV